MGRRIRAKNRAEGRPEYPAGPDRRETVPSALYIVTIHGIKKEIPRLG
jgi:hypothetical protein